MARPDKTVRLALCLTLAAIRPAFGASGASDPSKATQALGEAAAICRRDNGALWRTSLCGPILLVDPVTRLIIANQADGENQLTSNGASFVGKLPEQINIANTAIDWAGTKWTMIMLPLPEAKDRRAALMAHEMWHR